jgi:hypothetical protein
MDFARKKSYHIRLSRFIIFLFPFLVIGILIFFFLRILFPDWKPIEPKVYSKTQSQKETDLLAQYGDSYTQNEMINTLPLHRAGITGERILVGVMDTGFDLEHECYKSIKKLLEFDFLNRDFITADEDKDPWRNDEHGTIVLSVLAGYKEGQLIGTAYGSRFVLAKTEIGKPNNPELLIEEELAVEAIEFFSRIGVDVISSSLRFQWFEDKITNRLEQLDGKTIPITLKADEAVNNGIVFVQCAGNENHSEWGTLVPPADGFHVLTVGAAGSDGIIADFSSGGPTRDGRIKPDILAPGVRVKSADTGGHSAYNFTSGTSLAAPLAAGVVALMLSTHPDLSPNDVREALRYSADHRDFPRNRIGYGLIDAFKAVSYFGPAFSNTPKIRSFHKSIHISTSVISSFGILPDSVKTIYKTDQMKQDKVFRLKYSKKENLYKAKIPINKKVQRIYFHFTATDKRGKTSNYPREPLGTEFVLKRVQSSFELLPLKRRRSLYQQRPVPEYLFP